MWADGGMHNSPMGRTQFRVSASDSKLTKASTTTAAEFDVMIVIVFNVLAAKLALHSSVVVVTAFWLGLH